MTYISDIENRLEVVTWNGDKALEISNITPSGSPSFGSTYTAFISRSGPFTRPVSYSWNGQFNSNFGRDFLISFSSGSGIGGIMTTMKIKPNGQLYYSTNFVNEILLGTIDLNQPHTFIITFDKNTRLFGLSVTQPSETILAQEHPFREGSGPFPSTTRFRISFNFTETDNDPSINLNHDYLLDDLLIAHRNP